MSVPRATIFRIISFSLVAGDVFQTIPATLEMYMKNWNERRLSATCFFYAVTRYLSVISLVSNGYAAFSTSFTPESCKKYYMLPNVTALVAVMAIQVLVYIRTLAISGQSKYVRYGMGLLMLLGFPVQTFGIVYHRDPSFNNGTCKGKVLRAGEPDWNIVYYSAHMAFDLVAVVTATTYLVLISLSSYTGGMLRFSKLVKMILRDGLLYFVVVFAVNLWVVMEFAHVFTTGATSTLPLAVELIAAQHLILSTQRLAQTGAHSGSSIPNDQRRASPIPPADVAFASGPG
ncbi:hypothetical protein FB45DRAFT_1125279 [Roridomyces roridus]|uniref:Transmembrane protein n=1 Tax=Roridomyces roridus TaxID=1738132 RepID=A0AAD7C7J8_9AGAR|nr:hypothetical protein FB45DRAFT_1125279 [Roridomyces roridus]